MSRSEAKFLVCGHDARWEGRDDQPNSDAGGLTEFGTHVQTLKPGLRSSDRHWHEEGDEFLYVVSSEAAVIEEDGEHTLGPGDAACWPADAANAHRHQHAPEGGL